MRLAIAYSTRDQVELTEQTLPRIMHDDIDMYWCDGSRTDAGIRFFEQHPHGARMLSSARIYGGADAAIAWKLSTMLRSRAIYTHIGLLENDVLLDEDWFEPTMALFEKGRADGLEVGAVSPRSYVDRVLIQRDNYAVMHNIGAGAIIFTREAAEHVLQSFRTHWWPDNVRLFAQLSGIDLRTYAAFRGNEQAVTTDWGWEAQLARHGFASLALTPAKCQMLGQNPPLAEQGLELVTEKPLKGFVPSYDSYSVAFRHYFDNLRKIRERRNAFESPGLIQRDGAGMLFFAHQLGNLAGTSWQGDLCLSWKQGFGPFAYVAGPGGASLSVRVSGSCSFLCSGGDVGSSVKIQDTRSGFSFGPSLPAESDTPNGSPVSIAVPGTPVPRTITCDLTAGAVFYGLSTTDPQMLDPTFRFDWTQLPEAK